MSHQETAVVPPNFRLAPRHAFNRQHSCETAPSISSLMTAYFSRRQSVCDALKLIRRGGRIFIGSGCAEPTVLSRGLTDYAHYFADNPVVHILTVGEAQYTEAEFADRFRLNALFIGPNVRAAVKAGRADYTPIFLSEIPGLFRTGQMPLDAALIQVSPPDVDGMCSLGVSVDIVKAAVETARVVIAQVNPRMPSTSGESFIHLDQIDAIVDCDEPLPQWTGRPSDQIATAIGRYVATLIANGATLQVGIGTIPDAILSNLNDKCDLGIHSEMISDGVMRLVKQGVVTGSRKTLHPNAVVTSFCMGTNALYDWVDENPHVLFYPSDYVNDPAIIRKNDNMIAINSALAVDLTGQVCADSIGERFYSGVGGQVDFIRGAARSKGGRPIIAMPSTAKSADGKIVSRICSNLAEGAGVVTSRGDVHYIVTEYGIAYLHGKSVTERALALVEIAHPDFREELLAGAEIRHLTFGVMKPICNSASYPQEYEHSHSFNRAANEKSLAVNFRPIRISDERRLQDFFYSHSTDSIVKRYGNFVSFMSHNRAIDLVQIDYQTQMAFLALVGQPGNEQIIGVGRYALDENTGLAEVALIVHEDYRNLGIGKHLTNMLKNSALEQHFPGIIAQLSPANLSILHVLEEVLGAPDETELNSGEMTITFRFDEEHPVPAKVESIGHETSSIT